MRESRLEFPRPCIRDTLESIVAQTRHESGQGHVQRWAGFSYL